ncbi:Acyltransferase family protein [Planctomycetes bacterium Poly30]|uniref:Acyltransferase family protein n=1 Tax=Saltatorellus ferox TaxID=2528018 RepID=A0A518EN40_9BACT|nr:Acyltransferase family protein [Planctomycetes bacterium Poly30]
MRGLAVLLVLASHASNAGIDLVPPSWIGGLRAAGLGRPGVFLFFVLSSFLLTGQLLARIDGAEPICWRRFAARRLLRIMPAYALTLGILVIFGAMGERPALEHLALVRAEHHFWTIPVEVFFYLTLPVIVLLLGPLRSVALRLAVLGVAATALRWAFPPDFTSEPPRYRPNVAPFLPIFLAGSALAVVGPALIELRDRARRGLLVLASIASFALVLLTPSVWSLVTGEPVEHTRFHLWFDAFAVLWAVVLAAALQPGGWIRAAASWAPLRWLGQISYSVYLLHALVLGYFVDRGAALGLPQAALGPAFLAASCLAGAASYWLVERPFLGVLSARATAPPEAD